MDGNEPNNNCLLTMPTFSINMGIMPEILLLTKEQKAIELGLNVRSMTNKIIKDSIDWFVIPEDKRRNKKVKPRRYFLPEM